ncbi:MAG: ABC transporter permease subunit [Gemmatimonadaceae bacterium]|nr:ABC transporter permease subunit [Gemmatimonadaceae bacterium]
MIRDTWTVTHKEWMEIMDQFAHVRRGGWSILLVVAFLGIFVPLQLGPGWANLTIMFFYWPFITSSMTSTIVSDSVAGERERHTLETLLSTRLSDASILLGKVIAAVLYGYAFALSNLAIGLITVRVAFGERAEWMSAHRLVSLLVLLGTSATFVSGLGVLVSLRAATVRQAQQLFGVILLVATMIPVAAVQFVPEASRARISARLGDLGVEGVAWWISGTCAVLAAILLLIAVGRFRRGEVDLG